MSRRNIRQRTVSRLAVGTFLGQRDDGTTQRHALGAGQGGRRPVTSRTTAPTDPSVDTFGARSRPVKDGLVWAWLAWVLATAVIGLVVGAMVLRTLSGADLGLMVMENALPVPVTAVVGALIVSRRTRNAVGWMLLVSALGWAVQSNATAIVLYLHDAGEVTSAAFLWLAWLAAYGWVVSFPTVILLLPLLFPDGRLPSRRWRPVLLLALSLYLFGIVQTLVPGPLEVERDVLEVGVNPAAIHGLTSVVPLLEVALFVTFVPALAACVAAPVVRFRRSRGIERQQIKWLVPPILLLPIVLPLTGFAATETVGLALGAVATTSIPLAIGIAVLRYRLYEIDRVISRTLAYVALTVVLVAVYAAGVVGLGGVVRSVTAGGGGDVVVAASTLAVAALFMPARRRIQALVDRRFNRARYDAQRTAEAFAQRLRDEVDLDALTDDLREVVDRAMQPDVVSLWLAVEDARP
jgi:hypothetical protein